MDSRTETSLTEPRQTPSGGARPLGGPGAQVELYICGINHERASLAIRERFALDLARCGQALQRLRQDGLADESLLLSTCNRTELYVFGSQRTAMPDQMQRFILSLASGDVEEHHVPPFYVYDGLEAARHFFAVNSGLDSMILGENEIKAQIRHAFDLSQEMEVAGPNIHRLMEWANRCSKRIRTETKLNTGTLSFGKAAVIRAEQELGTLVGKVCIVIGAGKVGRVAAEAIAERNPARLIIVNRSPEKAKELAEGLRAEVAPIMAIAQVMPQADLIIGAAFAPNFLVTREMFEKVRGPKPLKPKVCLIDTAVPRILDKGIGDLDGVLRLDIGDLEGVISENRDKRKAAARQAWELVEEEVEKYHRHVRTSSLGPIIERMRARFEEVFAEALEALQDDAPDTQAEQLQDYHRRLKQRLLHEATREMKKLYLGHE